MSGVALPINQILSLPLGAHSLRERWTDEWVIIFYVVGAVREVAIVSSGECGVDT